MAKGCSLYMLKAMLDGSAPAASSKEGAAQDPLAVSRGRFVLRCAVTASLAYVIAEHIGLPHPVWAPMTALIVSQDRVTETLSSVFDRLAGTLLGIAIALLVSWLGAKADIALLPQIALGVAICAACASSRPEIRVCLWTCPLVLVPMAPAGSTEMTALFRGSEVMLGATVGGAMHFFEEKVILPLVRRVLAHRHRMFGSNSTVANEIRIDRCEIDRQRRTPSIAATFNERSVPQ